MKEIKQKGRVNAEGKLVIYMGEVNDWLDKHRGEEIILTIETISSEASEPTKAYYWRYIIPKIQKALLQVGERLTPKQTDEYLLVLFSDKTTEEMNQNEMNEYIESIKQFAAEELSVALD